MTRNENRKIFVVEDDPYIQVIVEMALSEIGGFNVEIFPEGEGLLSRLSEGELPSIILLDVMLPGDDGPTIFRKLKSVPEFVHIPIAFATARVSESDRQGYMDLGAVGVLSKPYDLDELCSTISEWLGKVK